MSLRQFFLILQARYKIVLYVLLGTVALTLLVSLIMPNQYTATTSLVVEDKPDPLSALLIPKSMVTQEDIIRSDRVAQRVVKLLRLDENNSAIEQWRRDTDGKGRVDDWLAERLQRRLSVVPARRDSNVMSIKYTGGDPAFAAAVANAFAQAYLDVTVEMKVDPAKQYARWFGEQSKASREDLEKAQTRLSEYQQKKSIVAREENLDAETARLNELTSQLTLIQTQTVDARSKERWGADTLPEVLQNSVIQTLRSDIARQEGKLKEAAGNLGKNHPQYRQMESELEELREKLRTETQHVASGYSSSGAVGRSKENELRAAIEAQKKKLLALRGQRDQLAVLQRDVDAARNAYDAITRQYTQTSLESRTNRTNVFLLTPAAEPLKPSSPNYLLYTLIATFCGTLLGLGAAFALELADRRIRTGDDFAVLPQAPLLVVIEGNKRMHPFDSLWRRVAALPFIPRRIAALTVK